MLNFNSQLELFSCGIDSEHIERFNRWSKNKEDTPPFIFSEQEINHIFRLKHKAKGLCVSFCCKEAFFKAIKEPYNFNMCELFWTPDCKEYNFM